MPRLALLLLSEPAPHLDRSRGLFLGRSFPERVFPERVLLERWCKCQYLCLLGGQSGLYPWAMRDEEEIIEDYKLNFARSFLF